MSLLHLPRPFIGAKVWAGASCLVRDRLRFRSGLTSVLAAQPVKRAMNRKCMSDSDQHLQSTLYTIPNEGARTCLKGRAFPCRLSSVALIGGMRFHEVIHGVYFDDLDIFGVLHNSRYMLLFERTIGDFWKKIGWGNALEWATNPDRFHLVRVNHMEYERAVENVSDVRARIWIEKLGTTSMVVGFKLMAVDEDIVYARGHRVHVCVNPKTKRPRPWSDELRRELEPYRSSKEQ